MDKFLARNKRTAILAGILFIILGIMIWVTPVLALESLVTFMGWALLIVGIVTLVAAMPVSALFSTGISDFIVVLLEVIPGLIMILAPGFVVAWVWILIGIYVVISGIHDVQEASVSRALGGSWVPAAICGVATAILGLMVMMMPGYSATLAMMFAGLVLIFDGITELIHGIRMPGSLN